MDIRRRIAMAMVRTLLSTEPNPELPPQEVETFDKQRREDIDESQDDSKNFDSKST